MAGNSLYTDWCCSESDEVTAIPVVPFCSESSSILEQNDLWSELLPRSPFNVQEEIGNPDILQP
eukprot:c43458_g1_i1 orf=2-190(-)